MTYDEVNPAFRVAFGVYEAYRRMGFPPEKLYAHLNQHHEFLYILRDGKKSFAFACGHVDMTHEDCEKRWREAMEFFVDLENEEAGALWSRLWEEFLAAVDSVKLIHGIMSKGFTIPVANRH